MAVANTKSNQITNADASPPVRNARHIDGANCKVDVGYVAVAAADDDNSVYRFVRVNSNVRVAEISIMNSAITAGTVYFCGLHETAANGGGVANGTAANAYLWDNLIDLSSARTNWATVAAADLAIANVEKKVWELAGFTSDPGRDFDITMTGSTVGTAAGSIAMQVWTAD